MLTGSLTLKSFGTVFPIWVTRAMDIILHLGAHRTATTSFQDYMRRQTDALRLQGVEYWGPRLTRSGLFDDILAETTTRKRNLAAVSTKSQLRTELALARHAGIKKLVISDENMIGSVRKNLHSRELYPTVRDRLASFAHAFEGQISSVIFAPRSLDLYWRSALSYGVSRRHPVPTREVLNKIAVSPRGWRAVISEIAETLPGVGIRVLPFERYAGRPDAMLAAGADVDAPTVPERIWLNETPTLPALRRLLNKNGGSSAVLPFGMGRWSPFTNEEYAVLRELDADDMMWLTTGADGLATLIEDRCEDRTGQIPSRATHEKGQFDELEERKVAQPGCR